MMMRWHKILTVTAIALTTTTVGETIAAVAPVATQQPLYDFTGVAKLATPAVVSVKVQGSNKDKAGLWSRDSDEDDEDLLVDPFLQHFFGMPRERRPSKSPSIGQASGFIVDPDGIVLTNNHVVADADEITVILEDGREFKAKVLGADPNTDLAVLKIPAKDLTALALGDSDKLEVGQWVAAMGNPWGLQASLSAGIVSAKGRNNLDLARIEDFIQTDAAINRGNSGGPIMNLKGEVVGVSTAIVTSSANGGYMGIGFAIPSNIAKHVVQDVMTDGVVSRGYLGLLMQAIDSNLAQALRLGKIEGALVTEIMKGAPADKAGLKQGDVILKYNAIPVVHVAALRNAIALMKPGSKLELTVWRDGKEIKVPVELGSFPTDKADGTKVSEGFGLQVETLTPELAQKYGYSDEQGIIVTKVSQGSSANLMGIRAGALILQVNGQKVASLEDYQQALARLEKGQAVLFLIKQGRAVRFVSLKIN